MTTKTARTTADATAVETELLKEIENLQARLNTLEAWIKRADRIVAATDEFGRIFGNYKGNDGRTVPAVITAAFPRAGTVDVYVFDNSYSGGSYQVYGIELGNGRNEMMPYLTETEEEDSDGAVMAT